jgi:hypothetical protein
LKSANFKDFLFTFMPGMKIKSPVFLLISLLGFLWMTSACTEETQPTEKQLYFPLATYLQQEIGLLIKHPQRVHKTMILDGKKEVKVISDMDWEKEWALFIESDLNKPAFDKSYDNLSEDGFLWYSLKIGENLPVKKLKIQLDALERPASIEIEMSQTNFLFDTQKKMHMNFVDGKVQTYSIEGTQQMRWGSPTHYQLLGVLLTK